MAKITTTTSKLNSDGEYTFKTQTKHIEETIKRHVKIKFGANIEPILEGDNDAFEGAACLYAALKKALPKLPPTGAKFEFTSDENGKLKEVRILL